MSRTSQIYGPMGVIWSLDWVGGDVRLAIKNHEGDGEERGGH